MNIIRHFYNLLTYSRAKLEKGLKIYEGNELAIAIVVLNIAYPNNLVIVANEKYRKLFEDIQGIRFEDAIFAETSELDKVLRKLTVLDLKYVMTEKIEDISEYIIYRIK